MNHSRICSVVAVLVAGLLFPSLLPGAETETAVKETNVVLGFSAGLTNQTRIIALKKKPPKFDSYIERLEFVHENLQPLFQGYVEKADTAMMSTNEVLVETPPSRFRITPSLEYKDQSSARVSLNPDFEAEVDLPNLERHWKIFLENTRDNALPGLDASERERGSMLGIRNIWEKYSLRNDMGINVKLPPRLFARIEWRREWVLDQWIFSPKERLFYQGGEGFGSLTSLVLHRWFGAQKNIYFQSVSAAKCYTEQKDGAEMEQTLKLGIVSEALENKWSWRHIMDDSDIARGHSVRYSFFWRMDSGAIIDKHRFTYVYRRPLYKQWIYLEIAPGMDIVGPDSPDRKPSETDTAAMPPTDWKIVPIIRAGVDMLFWGTYER